MADLSVYGLRIAVGGDWPEVAADVVRDFAWFRTAPNGRPADVEVTLLQRAPDYDRWAGLRPAFVTPRNVVYQDDGVTVVDYFGRALSVLHRQRGSVVATVRCGAREWRTCGAGRRWRERRPTPRRRRRFPRARGGAASPRWSSASRNTRRGT